MLLEHDEAVDAAYLTVSDACWERAAARAASEGRTISQVLRSLLEAYAAGD